MASVVAYDYVPNPLGIFDLLVGVLGRTQPDADSSEGSENLEDGTPQN